MERRLTLIATVVGMSALLAACVGNQSGSATRSAAETITSKAQNFVSICVPVVLASDNREAVMTSKGLKKGVFASGRKIGHRTWVHAGTEPDDNCRMSFGNVWPRNEVMNIAITSKLQQAGFKPTGQNLPISGGPLSGTGASSRAVFSNGAQKLTLEVAGGNSTGPIWALRALK